MIILFYKNLAGKASYLSFILLLECKQMLFEIFCILEIPQCLPGVLIHICISSADWWILDRSYIEVVYHQEQERIFSPSCSSTWRTYQEYQTSTLHGYLDIVDNTIQNPEPNRSTKTRPYITSRIHIYREL